MNVLATGGISRNPMKKKNNRYEKHEIVEKHKFKLPGMSQGLFARVTLLDIHTHQMLNEIFRRVTNFIPIW